MLIVVALCSCQTTGVGGVHSHHLGHDGQEARRGEIENFGEGVHYQQQTVRRGPGEHPAAAGAGRAAGGGWVGPPGSVSRLEPSVAWVGCSASWRAWRTTSPA